MVLKYIENDQWLRETASKVISYCGITCITYPKHNTKAHMPIIASCIHEYSVVIDGRSAIEVALTYFVLDIKEIYPSSICSSSALNYCTQKLCLW